MKKLTVKIGTHKTIKSLREDLEKNNCKISSFAEGIVSKVTLAKKPETLNLEVWSGEELGLEDRATTSDIYAAAKKQGLEPCPAEVGPQLRLQYLDQPKYEYLLVGMELLTDSDGFLRLFYIAHDVDGLWLYGSFGRADYQWCASYRWCFVRKSRAPLSLEPFDSSSLVRIEKKLDKLIEHLGVKND